MPVQSVTSKTTDACPVWIQSVTSQTNDAYPVWIQCYVQSDRRRHCSQAIINQYRALREKRYVLLSSTDTLASNMKTWDVGEYKNLN